MSPGHGLGHDVLGQELRAALDHDHGVAGAGQDHVQLAVGQLRGRGIEQEFTVPVADADGRDGAGEGDVGNVQGGRGSDHGQNVGGMFFVRGNDRGDDLDLVRAALGEKGANGTIDESRGQGFVVAGAADFAPEVAAGDAAGGVEHFLIVAGQGQEIHFALHGLMSGRDQDDGVAPAHGHRATGLQG